MTSDVWIKEVPGAEYTGPTSQSETVEFSHGAAERIHGREDGCGLCLLAPSVTGPTVVRTSYVVRGVRHDHSYRASFDR